jgi:hypothetical protein
MHSPRQQRPMCRLASGSSGRRCSPGSKSWWVGRWEGVITKCILCLGVGMFFWTPSGSSRRCPPLPESLAPTPGDRHIPYHSAHTVPYNTQLIVQCTNCWSSCIIWSEHLHPRGIRRRWRREEMHEVLQSQCLGEWWHSSRIVGRFVVGLPQWCLDVELFRRCLGRPVATIHGHGSTRGQERIRSVRVYNPSVEAPILWASRWVYIV